MMKQAALGLLIRSFRERNHLTQAALAKKLGVTDKAVSKWERGISFPDVSLFPKLADLLGVTSDDLLKGYAQEGQPSRLVQIFEMSHDIRTPLHIILGCADMAEKYHEDTGLLMRYLESIRVSGEYLLQVIDQAMQVTRPAAGETPPKKYPSTLAELEKRLEERGSQKRRKEALYDFSGKRILIAEDMEMNREIAKELLGRTGAKVEFAENGRVCVEMIRKEAPGYYDLVLMDIQMPEMNGIEATRRIRQLKEKKKAEIPIIAMTANVYDRDRTEAYEAGMNDFTGKPVIVEQLFSAISKALDGKKP